MAELAISGGEPAVAEDDIPPWPQITEKAKQYLLDCYSSGNWCRIYEGAEWTERLETDFADHLDADHAVAVSNGTVALELALRLCGVHPGDEVLVPAYTYIATANAIVKNGAIPRFVDVNPETLTIDPASLEQSITDRTVGVIGVHLAGRPINFEEVLPIVENNEMFLIEDCAQAHGTEWRGENVGTIGDVGAFSLQQTKTIPAGEGGLVITNDSGLADIAEMIHSIGRIPGIHGYKHYVVGSNYRLSEFQSAIATAQLEAFPDQNKLRQQNATLLSDYLADLDGIRVTPPDDRVSNRGYFWYTFNFDSEAFGGLTRTEFLEALNAEGVPAGEGYELPLHKQPAFRFEQIAPLVPSDVTLPRYGNRHLPGAESVATSLVSIPHRLLLADETTVKNVGRAIQKVHKHAGEIG